MTATRFRAGRITAGVILMTCLTTPMNAGDWQMDESASRLEFFITYTGQQAPGIFRRFETRIDFDPGEPADGRLDVTVDVTSADMDSAEINEAMAETDWFDYAGFPEARFSSMQLMADGDTGYRAIGTLSLKGIEKEISVPFNWREAGEAPDRMATLSGELTLDRGDFVIGAGEWASGELIGLKVQLRFEVILHPAIQ
jgi:polyisoprenoid-binding protein YceI